LPSGMLGTVQARRQLDRFGSTGVSWRVASAAPCSSRNGRADLPCLEPDGNIAMM